MTPANRLRHFNFGLAVATSLIASYVFLSPILPGLTFWLHREPYQLPYPNHLGSGPTLTQPSPVPVDNRLIIPAMRLNEVLYDGPTTATLTKGIWHWPHSQSPETGGNTVLIGHRFRYHDTAVFYHLDVVKTGDRFVVYWQHKEYDYQVFQVSVVPPSDTTILASSTEPIVTLYTCTPLWTSRSRLVVKAKLTATHSWSLARNAP